MLDKEEQRRAAALLQLADGDFFDFGINATLAAQEKLGSIAAGGALLALGAPSTIDLERHARIPVLAGSFQTGLRQWQVTYELNLFAVAVDVRSGAVCCARPLADFVREADVEPSAKGTPPGAFAAACTTSAVHLLDLSLFPALVWHPGDVALTLVAHDWVSNTVTFRIAGPEPSGLQEERVHPSAFIHDAAAPAAPGIALSVREGDERGPGVILRASLSLAAARAPTVRSAAPEGGLLVRASLLLFKLDAAPPARIDLAVPVRQGGAGQQLEAAFDIDLREAPGGSHLAGDYRAYLFAGDRVSGPHPLSFS